jgi:hypothetical protein
MAGPVNYFTHIGKPATMTGTVPTLLVIIPDNHAFKVGAFSRYNMEMPVCIAKSPAFLTFKFNYFGLSVFNF